MERIVAERERDDAMAQKLKEEAEKKKFYEKSNENIFTKVCRTM